EYLRDEPDPLEVADGEQRLTFIDVLAGRGVDRDKDTIDRRPQLKAPATAAARCAGIELREPAGRSGEPRFCHLHARPRFVYRLRRGGLVGDNTARTCKLLACRLHLGLERCDLCGKRCAVTASRYPRRDRREQRALLDRRAEQRRWARQLDTTGDRRRDACFAAGDRSDLAVRAHAILQIALGHLDEREISLPLLFLEERDPAGCLGFLGQRLARGVLVWKHLAW